MDEIERIKQALRQIVQQIVASGRPISGEVRQALTLAMEHARNRITELRGEPIPAGAEQLWALAGENRQAFQSYLQSVPNAGLNALSNEPVRRENVEDRLAQRITSPAGESEDGIAKAGLQSSNVYGFSYNPRNSKLFVRFQGGGVYEYEDVPPLAFKLFQQGAIPAKTNGQNRFGRWWEGKKPSLGASFYNIIRDRYPYQRVA